jgi:translation elongation factor EF-4
VINGTLRAGDKVKFFATGKEYQADEIASEVKVGDTITHVNNACETAISGFEDVKPMVFAGLYPTSADEYEDLRASLEKLQLNDASLTFEPESSLSRIVDRRRTSIIKALKALSCFTPSRSSFFLKRASVNTRPFFI